MSWKSLKFYKNCAECGYLNPDNKKRFKCFTSRCPAYDKEYTKFYMEHKLKKLEKKTELVKTILNKVK